MTYALWLVPSEEEHGALQRLMNFRPQKCSSRTHTSGSYPRFSPHITLAAFSSTPMVPLPELLPQVKATPVQFESIKVGSSSLSVVISQSRELMELHDYTVGHLKKAHGIHASSHSFPHMPLFYLDETVYAERFRLANILRSSGRVVERRGAATVGLNCTLDGAAPEFDAMTGFLGSEIWLVDCTGAVAHWKVLETRKLVRRRPCIPRSSPFIYRPTPVIPVVSDYPGLRGCMPPASHIQPFFCQPKPVPVIPASPYHPKEPRSRVYHYAQERNTNVASAPAGKRAWAGYHDYR